MWCQPISLDTTLMTGESFEVFYRKFPDTTWIPYLPNPLSNVFDICGLVDGNYEIKARRVKADGTRCKESSATFTIGTVLCVGLLPITYDLPDASIGVPYNVTIPFAGTLPATIISSTLPAWMTISIVGTDIVLSGMPTGIPTNDVAVEFEIDNCAESSIIFADTINTTAPVSGFVPVVTETPNELSPICYRDIQIDFNVGNSNFSYDITFTALLGIDQLAYDGFYPSSPVPATPYNLTKTGGGSPSLTRLRGTVGGGAGYGVSGFSIDIIEYYLGAPTGNQWLGFVFGSLNNDVQC